MASNPQREFYDSMRNKYRKFKDIDEIPKFMRIYL